MPIYLDTSAAVKLVVKEPETTALRRWLRGNPREAVSSDLTRIELLRATRRAVPRLMTRARTVLDSLTLVQLTTELAERAALLDPPSLRSLDAIHLATALALGDELEGIVTYDHRMATAATALGLHVIAPT